MPALARAERARSRRARASSATSRPAVRSSGPALDAALPFVRAAARPRVRARAARPRRRPAPDGARRWPRSTSARVPLYEQVRAGVELPERGRSCRGPRTRSRTRTFPADGPGLPGGDQAARPASPARAARATPTASGSACSPPAARTSPTRSAPASFFVTTASRSTASTRRRPTSSARRCGPTCRARPRQPPDLRTIPRRRRRSAQVDTLAPPFQDALREGARRRPSTGCSKQLKAEGLATAQGLRQGRHAAAHRQVAKARASDRDPQARRATSRDHRARRDRRRRRRLHPRTTSACASRGRGEAVPAQGRVLDRAGRHAGPGPDRARLGRARSATSPRSSSRTAARS